MSCVNNHFFNCFRVCIQIGRLCLEGGDKDTAEFDSDKMLKNASHWVKLQGSL